MDACARAGLPAPELIQEPVAAASLIALAATPRGRHVAVYDWGGGTFDRGRAGAHRDGVRGRRATGRPRPARRRGHRPADRRAISASYSSPITPTSGACSGARSTTPSRKAAADLRGAIQGAKETLSETASCQLRVPLIERDIQITRKELEDLISDDVNLTVDALETRSPGPASPSPTSPASIWSAGRAGSRW